MSVESGVFSLLSSDADLAAALGLTPDVLPARLYRAGAANDPVPPFLSIRWEIPTLAGRLGTYGFTLRAHDRDLTYDRITAALDRAKAILTAVVHQQGITQVDWQGRSPDLFDDGYRTLTKYDTYVVAAGLTTREEV